MNNKRQIPSITRARGITLVEILLVISLLVVLLSFAIPSIGSATAKAEMTATAENVQHAIESARKTARMNETVVKVVFDAPAGENSSLISFDSKVHTGILDYRLPESVFLISDQDVLLFDERGLVSNPVQVTLVSRADDSVTSTMTFE